jgi:prepilin-type N-terminal cleavage/methylation domain-containing protein
VLTRARRPADDTGLTLVELLVSITLMGIVLGSVVGVTFVAARTAAASKIRLDESGDLVRAAAYFTDDVQGAQGVAVDSTPLCGPDATAVVEFQGQDFTDDATLAVVTTVVTYVLRNDDDPDAQTLELHRLACRADSAGPAYPLAPVTDVTVASGLTAEPRVTCSGALCAAGFTQVELAATRTGGLGFTLTGRRRTTP